MIPSGLAAALVLSGAHASGAQQADTLVTRRAITVADVRLREAPDATGRTIVILPRSVRVVVGDCGDEWCDVDFRGIKGFAARRYLAFGQRMADTDTAVTQQTKPPLTTRGYINSRGRWVPSPQRTPDGRPPAGASARCRDGTYSFSQSRRGTCSHHGGVSRWLP